jgi:hypothetical protein
VKCVHVRETNGVLGGIHLGMGAYLHPQRPASNVLSAITLLAPFSHKPPVPAGCAFIVEGVRGCVMQVCS